MLFTPSGKDSSIAAQGARKGIVRGVELNVTRSARVDLLFYGQESVGWLLAVKSFVDLSLYGREMTSCVSLGSDKGVGRGFR